MEILYVLVPLALVLAGAGVLAFRWAVRDGQFDDLDSQPVRVLFDDESATSRPSTDNLQ